MAPLLLRVLRGRAFWLLALVPAATFGWLVWIAPRVLAGEIVTESQPWIAALGIDVSLRIGTLQLVLALVVSGIGALVAGSALTVACTLRFVWGAFAGKTVDGVPASATSCHRVAPGFVAVPLVLAALCLVGGFTGHQLTAALEGYVGLVTVGEPSHGIALWHGFTVPLLLSAVALSLGAVLFWQRGWIARAQSTFPSAMEAEDAYQQVMRGIDRLAVEVTSGPARLAAGLPRLDHAGRGRPTRRRAAGPAALAR